MRVYTDTAAKIRKEDQGEATNHHKTAEAERARARALKSERAAAIETGNQEKYLDICREIEYHEGRARYEDDLAASEGTSPAVYADAWTDYVEDFNKEYNKRLKDFNKIKMTFAKAYIELLTFYAEANRQTAAARRDLEGARSGIMPIWETLPKIDPLPVSKPAFPGQSPEGAVTCGALQLDQGRAENVADIENGLFTGIYDKTTGEMFTDALKKRPLNPVFFYPVELPETEEERIYREKRGDYNHPIGYIYPDGSVQRVERDPQKGPAL